jgi:hypothetical protein
MPVEMMMHQSAIWLSREMHRELKQSPLGISGEIRRRLEEWQMLYSAGYKIERKAKITWNGLPTAQK